MKKLFIGSSSEAKKYAEEAKSILKDHFDVTIWYENALGSSVFNLNQNFLTDLLKASLEFDFGILIGTKDDKVKCGRTRKLQPRDNVIFELGLFTGRLGISKCAFVVEEDVKLPSDINGITLAIFDKHKKDSFKSEIEKVSGHFLRSSDEEINFFPSVTLASVYYENFLLPTCKYLIENKGLDYLGKHYDNCKVNVIIPENIQDDVNLQFQRLKHRFTTKDTEIQCAGRPRKITIEAEVRDETLMIIDFPTIISGINYAIKNLFPDDFNTTSQKYLSILERELGRFISTLHKLLSRNEFGDLVVIRKESDL
jgi:hypothetical protein